MPRGGTRNVNARKRVADLSSDDESDDGDGMGKLQQIMLLMKEENGKKKRRRVQKFDRVAKSVVEQLNETSTVVFDTFMQKQAQQQKIVSEIGALWQVLEEVNAKQARLTQTYVQQRKECGEAFQALNGRFEALVNSSGDRSIDWQPVTDAMRQGRACMDMLYERCVHEMEASATATLL